MKDDFTLARLDAQRTIGESRNEARSAIATALRDGDEAWQESYDSARLGLNEARNAMVDFYGPCCRNGHHDAARPRCCNHLRQLQCLQIQVGDRVLAESPTGEEDIAFGSEIIPSDWRRLTLWAPQRDGTVAEFVLLSPLMWLKRKIVCIQSATEPDDYGDANSMRPEIARSEKCSVNRTSPMASNAQANDDVA